MKKLSQTLSILIPMFNEEGRIERTLEDLVRLGFHERFKIFIIDDASTDSSVKVAEEFVKDYPGSFVLCRRAKNGRKTGAILSGLEEVETPFVLLLDADSVPVETRATLDDLVAEMSENSVDAMGFKIVPIISKGRLVEKFQVLEYVIISESVRNLLDVVVCLDGTGALWNTSALHTALAEHSGVFEGDDLETTLIAHRKNMKVAYTHDMIIRPVVKSSWFDLFRQRATIWDFGLIRVLSRCSDVLTRRDRHGAFFRSTLIIDLLCHPLKVLSFLAFLLLLVYPAKNSPIFFSVMIRVYSILVVLNLVSIAFMRESAKLKATYLVYLGIYMFAPYFHLLLNNDAAAAGAAYVLWYAICAYLILLSSEPLTTKGRLLWWALPFPVYFAILLIFPRTYALVKYLIRSVHEPAVAA